MSIHNCVEIHLCLHPDQAKDLLEQLLNLTSCAQDPNMTDSGDTGELPLLTLATTHMPPHRNIQCTTTLS